MENKTKQFIIKANKIHGDKYDYSLVNYENIKTKIDIICPNHGIFKQTPHHHITRKQGCGLCRYINISKLTRDTLSNFIKKAKNIHGNKYDYSLVIYINNHTKIKIVCPNHGVFFQKPKNHLIGNICGKCRGLYTTLNSFIEKAKNIHGNKYDYSSVLFKNLTTKITIICNKHGKFNQLPNAHINGQGCPKCCGLFKTTDDFILEAKKIHGDKYDYSKINYINSYNKLDILCKIHNIFKQSGNDHLQGKGCPICKESKGEKKIREYLIKNNIKYIQEYKFKDCKNVQSLPFDFYLPDYNVCIEYDGIQHFKPINRFGGENGYFKLKFNDNIKTHYCFNMNIKLIRIKYTEDIYSTLNIFLTSEHACGIE